jgi:hypothetical protein
MRFRTTSALLVVTLAVTACDGGYSVSPTGPAPPVSTDTRPDPPQVRGDRWNLTTIQRAVTGPGSKICWRNADGTRIEWRMAVQRSGQSVSFLYDVDNWPLDHVELKGMIEGEQFTASADRIGDDGSEPWTGGFPCGGTQVKFLFEAEVSGQFSASGQALTATEVMTYRLTSGEVVSITHNWVARSSKGDVAEFRFPVPFPFPVSFPRAEPKLALTKPASPTNTMSRFSGQAARMG